MNLNKFIIIIIIFIIIMSFIVTAISAGFTIMMQPPSLTTQNYIKAWIIVLAVSNL